MIKLNAGFSRKVGEANYSSRGASVNVDLELESALIQEPEKLHEKIRVLFGIAKKAVDEELQNGNGRDRPDRKQAPKPQPEVAGFATSSPPRVKKDARRQQLLLPARRLPVDTQPGATDGLEVP
jgi:hypothetical protein